MSLFISERRYLQLIEFIKAGSIDGLLTIVPDLTKIYIRPSETCEIYNQYCMSCYDKPIDHPLTGDCKCTHYTIATLAVEHAQPAILTYYFECNEFWIDGYI